MRSVSTCDVRNLSQEPPPGSAGNLIWPSPAVLVALTIGKNCTFCSDRDRGATIKGSFEPFVRFTEQDDDQDSKRCIFNRTGVRHKAAPPANPAGGLHGYVRQLCAGWAAGAKINVGLKRPHPTGWTSPWPAPCVPSTWWPAPGRWSSQGLAQPDRWAQIGSKQAVLQEASEVLSTLPIGQVWARSRFRRSCCLDSNGSLVPLCTKRAWIRCDHNASAMGFCTQLFLNRCKSEIRGNAVVTSTCQGTGSATANRMAGRWMLFACSDEHTEGSCADQIV